MDHGNRNRLGPYLLLPCQHILATTPQELASRIAGRALWFTATLKPYACKLNNSRTEEQKMFTIYFLNRGAKLGNDNRSAEDNAASARIMREMKKKTAHSVLVIS